MIGGGRAARGRHQAGVALLLTVWLLTLLAVIAGESMTSVRVRAAVEHNKRDDLGALALAQAGYRAALAALGEDLEGISIDEDDRLQLHYRDRPDDPVPAQVTDAPFEGGAYSYRIRDEEGLVNINRVRSGDLAKLLQRCGLGPGVERDTVIDSILDWRDPSREHRLNGAEEEYYRGLAPPYSCKDGPFEAVEELLLVRGVRDRRQLFYGGEEDGETKPGLRDLVTVSEVTTNRDTEPKDVREALGHTWTGKRVPPSEHYEIVATGRPDGSALRRSLRAVVIREPGAGGDFGFTLVYYNDTYIPE